MLEVLSPGTAIHGHVHVGRAGITGFDILCPRVGVDKFTISIHLVMGKLAWQRIQLFVSDYRIDAAIVVIAGAVDLVSTRVDGTRQRCLALILFRVPTGVLVVLQAELFEQHDRGAKRPDSK